MQMKRLEFGDSLSGLLIDGVDGTPYVGATILMTQERGITVEVPYLPDPSIEQFNHVLTWFRDQSPPSNMLFATRDGTISLFDVVWSGQTETWDGSRTSVGTLRPTVTAFGVRPGPLEPPLVIEELRSRLDGLNEWSRLSCVEQKNGLNEANKVRSVEMHIQQNDGLTWRQGEVTMAIRAGWRYSTSEDGYNRLISLQDNAFIESSSDSGQMPFLDHLIEQRKVANLMVFLFGLPLSFREHNLRDELFATSTSKRPEIEVVSSYSYRERRNEVPTPKKLGRPLAHMAQIGSEGLEAWSENYETWKRFILPSAGALGNPASFLEDIIVSTSMSIEAAGVIIGERPGERETWSRARNPKPTTATYAFRCLDVLDAHWPDPIADRVSLARAVANNYNDVKHFDRGDFPQHDESHVVSEVNQMIVRLLAICLTGKEKELLTPYRRDGGFHEIQQMLDAYTLSLDKGGKWKRASDKQL
ncbi:ApeA N-terminal domain 1-containing protein [Brachybacterium hainanense]|uniref:ApeA N-terminal domain-containing protein n=1 Tax=Brachybacterium hainanense TaxID=1541174 RepID=A0ABV6R888_9MICO